VKFILTPFEGLYEINLNKIGDSRGWFKRTYDINLFSMNIPNFKGDWKQMNHSYSEKRHTWRGLHYQISPFQESKLVRCVKGSIIDYALDLRRESSTYLKVFKINLSSKNGKTLYIPKGFAHGYFTLEDNTELIYLVDEFYNPNYEKGVRFDDKKICLNLPFKPEIISEKDKSHKSL
jgi:dTDP-4-dehydrorhamnose 3,5-epimerase